jgi:hypothetical protein
VLHILVKHHTVGIQLYLEDIGSQTARERAAAAVETGHCYGCDRMVSLACCGNVVAGSSREHPHLDVLLQIDDADDGKMVQVADAMGRDGCRKMNFVVSIAK